jgi:hypothetical protein
MYLDDWNPKRPKTGVVAKREALAAAMAKKDASLTGPGWEHMTNLTPAEKRKIMKKLGLG